MRAALAFTLLLLASLHANAQSPTEEFAKLAGSWKPQSIIYEDINQLDGVAKQNLTLVIENAEYRMYWLSDPATKKYMHLFTAKIQLDTNKKTIILTVEDGKGKGKQMHGIYNLNGDTFTICYGDAGKPLPTTFASAKGSGHFLETWTREKR